MGWKALAGDSSVSPVLRRDRDFDYLNGLILKFRQHRIILQLSQEMERNELIEDVFWSREKGRHKGGPSHQKENGSLTVELTKNMCVSPAW